MNTLTTDLQALPVSGTLFQESDIAGTLAEQRRFFATNATKSLDFRITQLKKLKKAVADFEAPLMEALKKDLNKTGLEAFGTEIAIVNSEIDVAIKKLKSWANPKSVFTPFFHFPARSKIYNDPYGVVLIIGPWNYPFQLVISPLVGAIAAGNCAMLKPSELAPNVSALLATMIKQTFQSQYVAIFEGDVTVAHELLENKFDYIFFTGGTAVGKLIYQAAAKNLTPVTLELGGKSPCIVHKDANIKLSARRILWGKLLNAGQTCVAPDYVFVHRQIKHELIVAMKEELVNMLGENAEDSPYYCRIISDRHLKRLEGLLQCGNIIAGGRVNPATRYIEPTLLENVSHNDPIMQEEIFGPILPILDYENLDEVIQFITNRPKPLALYIFAESREVVNRVLEQTSSGSVGVNETVAQMSNANMPFGGVGDSGIGAYHGKYSFDTFSHKKSVMFRTTLIDPPLRYMPYKFGEKLLRMLTNYTLH
ncbi:aldehyde dehydrogenase [Sphingobacteriales bacterium UPWRP_1]|nr:aldehyde dehydrogenase family protein [Sphingobacteriales bacterium TSM_CSS]PSJ76413.1 aldehyde dehydrogenase [Sphingobacteriales bacterium UPWRP_1]